MADENEPPEQQPLPEQAPPPEPAAADVEFEAEQQDFEDAPYTAADFHTVIHKQLIHAVADTLSEHKPHWEVVAPFLDTAREMCRSDFETAGSVQLHGLVQQEEEVVEAEEAYVEFTIADQDDNHLWFQETFWLSDIILTDPDPAHVRDKIRALERSIARLNQWLAEQEAPPADAPAVP
jgi:hypothetical protein